MGGASGFASMVKSVVESIAKYKNLDTRDTDKDLSKIINLTSYINKDITASKDTLTNLGLNVVVIGNGEKIVNQYPKKGENILSGNKIFLVTDYSEIVMPNIIGWNSSDVRTFANLINLSYTMNDYGKVTAQSIPEGTILDSASMLEVTLGGLYGKEKAG